MNIFFLSRFPRKCAKYHIDKHVVKMILETAQLLSTTWWVLEPSKALDIHAQEHIYRKTHVNHPCAIWARETLGNYTWLAQLGLALCKEYTHRYGRIHKTQDRLQWMSDHVPMSIPLGDMVDPPRCMPDELKSWHGSTVSAYRRLYIRKKQYDMPCRWTNRDQPKWFIRKPDAPY